MEKKEFLNWLSNNLLMPVTEQTIFLKDIQYAGVEIDLFFIGFFKTYDIDSTLLNLNDYTLEDSNFLEVWFKGKRAKTFNVDHLLKVIELKKWYDPDQIDEIINN